MDELRKTIKIVVVLVSVYAAGVSAADLPPYTSMVYPGIDGKLVYVPDEQGNIIPDYSHAGYRGGGSQGAGGHCA